MIKSPRKNVADPAGVSPQPSDHQSDAHQTEADQKYAWPVSVCMEYFMQYSMLDSKLNISCKSQFPCPT